MVCSIASYRAVRARAYITSPRLKAGAPNSRPCSYATYLSSQVCNLILSSFVPRNLEPCTDAAPDVSNFSTPVSVLDRMELAECNCDVGTQQCPAEAEGPEPPMVVMPSFDYLGWIPF